MKIGNSLGRCVRDIVLGKVDFDDVLVIISRTWIESPETLVEVIDDYLDQPGYLKGLEPQECHSVAARLWNGGKLHQPRLVSNCPPLVDDFGVWMDAYPTELLDNPSVVAAWENYRIALTMASEQSSRLRTG